MTGAAAFAIRILLALSLYVFLGWAMLILWRDLQRQNQTIGKKKIPQVQLNWMVDHQDQTIQFTIPEILIGRDLACDCHIQDETISARHARLSYHHNQWWLEDLHSTNGTFLNQERVDIPTVIVTGDEFRCGQVEVLISVSEK